MLLFSHYMHIQTYMHTNKVRAASWSPSATQTFCLVGTSVDSSLSQWPTDWITVANWFLSLALLLPNYFLLQWTFFTLHSFWAHQLTDLIHACLIHLTFSQFQFCSKDFGRHQEHAFTRHEFISSVTAEHVTAAFRNPSRFTKNL